MLRSNLQERSTADCATCMNPTLWSDDGVGNSLKASVHDEDCSGQLSLVMPKQMESVQQAVLQNQRFTISEHSVQWLQMLAVDSCDTGVQTLLHWYNKCLNNGGDC